MSINEFHVPLLGASANGNHINFLEQNENFSSITFMKTIRLANKVKLEPHEAIWIYISTDSLDQKKSYCFKSTISNKHIFCYDSLIGDNDKSAEQKKRKKKQTHVSLHANHKFISTYKILQANLYT